MMPSSLWRSRMMLIVGRGQRAAPNSAVMSFQGTAFVGPPPEVARSAPIAAASASTTRIPASRSLVDVNRFPVGLGVVEALDHEVGDAHAAVGGRVGGHRRVAVDRVPAGEVHRL